MIKLSVYSDDHAIIQLLAHPHLSAFLGEFLVRMRLKNKAHERIEEESYGQEPKVVDVIPFAIGWS